MADIYQRTERIISCRRASIALESTISITMLVMVCFCMIMAARVQYMGECMDEALYEAGQSIQFSIGFPDDMEKSSAAKAGISIISEGRARMEFDKVITLKGLDKSAYEFKMTRLEDGSFDIAASVGISLPLAGNVRSYKNMHVVVPDLYGDRYDDGYTVSIYGERYHMPSCHTIRGHSGLKEMSAGDARASGRTPCSICIGKTLFGKPYDPEL